MNPVLANVAKAALPHVAFDGWSEASLRAACADLGLDPAIVRLHVPRGGLDLAAAAHLLGDEEMVERLKSHDLSGLRFRDRMVEAVMIRLQAAGDREAVRRASSLFALPQNAAEGAKLIWGTVDRIWEALGDSSQDLNWYSKRMTLAAIYSATVLYWLGDESEEAADTRAFVERRIASVMSLEETKGKLRRHPLTAPWLALQDRLASLIPAPRGKDSSLEENS